MPGPLSGAERDRIVELLPTGMSCRQIAERVGRSASSVSRVAADVGHTWGRVNSGNAAQAKQAYGAERRAALMTRLLREAEGLLDQLHEPFLAYNIGGKDNVYTDHELPRPDVKAQRDLVAAASTAVKSALDIDKHDNRSTDVEQAAGLITQLVDGLRHRKADDGDGQ